MAKKESKYKKYQINDECKKCWHYYDAKPSCNGRYNQFVPCVVFKDRYQVDHHRGPGFKVADLDKIKM